MSESGKLEKPETRWQALIALVAVGGLYTALPASLSVGPRWLLLLIILVMLVPTIVSHRRGRHSVNQVLGILINSIITAALAASLVLLVAALPAKKETPVALLVSAAALWMTTVLVFAQWYWRLDGGGPGVRHKRGIYGSRAFYFPQLQVEKDERAALGLEHWSPGFIDYLFVAFNTSTAFSPTDTPILQRWAKMLSIMQSLISLATVALLIARAINVL